MTMFANRCRDSEQVNHPGATLKADMRLSGRPGMRGLSRAYVPKISFAANFKKAVLNLG